MKLAALICAYAEAPDAPGGLRATLPLTGRTLVERQARLAAKAGANPVVLLVERVPPELLAAIDRLRTEAAPVLVARTAADAAAAVGGAGRLLVLADGLVAERTHIDRLLSAGAPSLLTVPDTGDDRFERIDADARWAGLALLDGAALGDTAGMLRDWDLQSTLLRRAVQAGARQIAVRADAAEPPFVIAERGSDLLGAHDRILRGANPAGEDWASHFLLAPIEASAARALLPTPLTPAWLQIAAGVMTGLAAVLFTGGWLWFGAALMLLATPLDGAAARLAGYRLQEGATEGWPARLLPWLAGAALVALGYHLSATHGWGCLLLAGVAILFLIALAREAGASRARDRLFFAERKGMTWLMLPFAAAGAWLAGLAALACYAAGSFFWAQSQAHRPGARRQQD